MERAQSPHQRQGDMEMMLDFFLHIFRNYIYIIKDYLYLSAYFFVIFCFLFILFAKYKKRILKILSAIAALGSATISYAYYIEPNILLTKKQDIYLSENKKDFIKIALVADTHRGHFKTGIDMKRIVDRLKQQNPDIVFILGDFLGDLPIAAQELSYFKKVNPPVYSVLGNHESYEKEKIPSLEKALIENNIKILRNHKFNISIKGKAFELVGLEDLEMHGLKGVDWSLLENKVDKPRIVLSHNPNTALFLEEIHQFDIMFSGHTHGAQVNIGLPVFDSATGRQFFLLEGHKREGRRQYYVSAGTGMTALPIRFMRPPRIDIIHLYD